MSWIEAIALHYEIERNRKKNYGISTVSSQDLRETEKFYNSRTLNTDDIKHTRKEMFKL